MIADDVVDLAAAIALLFGAFFTLAAGVGLIRFPDALTRLHASTKPQVLGLIFVLAAIALESREWATLLTLVPVLVFQLLTAPISAHMVGRAGYRAGDIAEGSLVVDELDDAIERAGTAHERPPTERL